MNKKTLSIAAILIIFTETAFTLNASSTQNNTDNQIKEEEINESKPLIFTGKPGVQISTKKINVKTEETKIVNGVEYTKTYNYWLPPEPDKNLNNSTLAGVDVNNNKVRDDIERKIVMNPKWSAGLKGARLQEARTYFLAMESPDQYPHVKNLLDKAYDLEYYYESGRNINISDSKKEEKDYLDSLFNTDERKLAYAKIQSKFSGGVYNVIYQPHRFVERYADYKVSERGSLKDYELKPEAYDNKPTPYFDPIGHIQGYYDNGKAKDLTTTEFCETNYGTPNYNECKEKSNQLKKLVKERGVDNLIKEGLLHE